ncbi:TlpA family protein disulfide reductase [Actinopolyspora halophila]|uniref:TlpA family protein disulfide reductase n=1 Tax=Actinopolyspora halophila TaxID=1850 RepID=UPI0006869C2F|nr:redoxin family protein [Actinopolyspora halophila]
MTKGEDASVEWLDGLRKAKRWRVVKWSIALVMVAVIGVGAMFGTQLGKDPSLVRTPLIGEPAPSTRVSQLDGSGTLSLPELRGQVIVVNFWASWCTACREEHDALTAAATNYRDQAVTFVGVNYQDRHSSAVRFLDELGRGPGYRYVTDPGSELAIEFGVFGIPETFFIDRDGTIVAKITGPSNYRVLSETLDDILAGRKPVSRTQGKTFQR